MDLIHEDSNHAMLGAIDTNWIWLSDQMKTILSAPWQFPIIAAVSVIIWQCRM